MVTTADLMVTTECFVLTWETLPSVKVVCAERGSVIAISLGWILRELCEILRICRLKVMADFETYWDLNMYQLPSLKMINPRLPVHPTPAC